MPRNFGLHRHREDFDFSYPCDGPLNGFWLVPSIIGLALAGLLIAWLWL